MTRYVLAAFLASAVLFSCAPAPVVPMSSGSIAVSRDDALLYVADADHDRLTLIDANTGQVKQHVAVGRRPERVAVAPDGTVFVTNRGSRSVTRLTRDGQVMGSADVGAEPVGLSFSRDGKKVFVANSTAGTVSELDAQNLTLRRTHQVGGTPWAVAVSPDTQTLYVTDFLDAQLKVVSLNGGGTQSARLGQPAGAECPSGVGPARTPAQPADVIVSPEGDRVYVAHVQSRNQPSTQNGTTPNLAFAVAPALSTVDTQTNTTLQEPPRNAWPIAPAAPDFPATVLSTNLDDQCSPVNTGMDAPSSLVVDGLGDWLFVADHNSNAVAVVSATRRVDDRFASPERGIYGVVGVGARPTGIAVAGDLKRAWVHNALDYTVSLVELKDGALVQSAVYPFADSDLAPAVERGRRLFYSAVDPRLSTPQLGGLSCSSCHPEGRTDGLSWSLPDNGSTQLNPWDSWKVNPARNTPALWSLADTAPYAWDGAQPTLPAFNSHMVMQMGGGGLSSGELLDVSAFLGTLQAPDNPNVLKPEQGARVFAQHCQSCHAGPALTDGLRHTVGGASLDTPSLRAVFASGPWLHDGSAATLRDALWHPGGAPSTLSSSDTEALEVYLRSL